jgi:hypothetical protein
MRVAATLPASSLLLCLRSKLRTTPYLSLQQLREGELRAIVQSASRERMGHLRDAGGGEFAHGGIVGRARRGGIEEEPVGVALGGVALGQRQGLLLGHFYVIEL